MKYLALAILLAFIPAVAHAQGNVVELDGLKSAAPAGWKLGAADNKFRAYQFKVPKADGDKEDAELVIFYFGPGAGGGVDENLKRWKGFFQGKDEGKIEKFKVGDVPVTTLDVKGTYLTKFPPFAPNAKVIRKADYRMIGVVFQSKDGPYFFRLVGPERTVAANREAFEKWVKNFQ